LSPAFSGDLDTREILEVHGIKHVLGIAVDNDHVLLNGRSLMFNVRVIMIRIEGLWKMIL